MKYNLLKTSICNTCYDNTVLLPDSYFSYINDYSDTSLVTLSGANVLSIEFDLTDRIAINKIEYKFVSYNADEDSTSSGIKFYYKNNINDAYNNLVVDYYDDWVFSCTPIQNISPRYIKITHDITQTYNTPTASGLVYGVKVYNNDSIVDFGQIGELNEETVEVVRDGTEYIRQVHIYNNGLTKADAVVAIDCKYSDVDKVINISESSNGPWIGNMDQDSMIFSSNNFNSGGFSNTIVYGDSVVIKGGVLYDGSVVTCSGVCTYITPILDVDNNRRGKKLIFDYELNNGKLAVYNSDSTNTVEIRGSNELPAPYTTIRVLYSYYSGGYWVSYKDLWVPDSVIKETGSKYINSSGLNFPCRNYGVVIGDSNLWAGWYSTNSVSDARYTSSLYLYNYTNSSFKTFKMLENNVGGQNVNYYVKDFYVNYDGGIWSYLFMQGYRSNDFIDTTGYYIIHMDSSMSSTFKWFSAEASIGQIASTFNNNDLWYTDPTSSTIYKIDTYGDVSIEVADMNFTSDLGPIYVMSDNNVVFTNGVDVHYLREDGLIMEELSLYGVSISKIDCVVADYDMYNFVWIVSDLTVKRIFATGERKGQIDFEVSNIGYPIKLKPYSGGVWVKCSDSEVSSSVTFKFISTENRRIDYEYSSIDDSEPCLTFIDYKSEDYLSVMRTIRNNSWNTLEWGKVTLSDVSLPECNYAQLRFTLRRPDPYKNWPEITSNPYDLYKDNDFFNNGNIVPDKLMWGTWYNYPLTDYVFNDTVNSRLILKSNTLSDSYINTRGRVVYGLSEDGFIEIIIGYKIANGNGVASGKQETLSVILSSVNPGKQGYSAKAKLNIPVNPLLSSSNISLEKVDGVNQITSKSMVRSLDYYEGELRILLNANTSTMVAGQRLNNTLPWDIYTNSLVYDSVSFGNLFFLSVVGYYLGSDTAIKYVLMGQGTAYAVAPTPRLHSGYTQKEVYINDILPNTYKDVYIKLSADKSLNLPSLDFVDIKTTWRVPV